MSAKALVLVLAATLLGAGAPCCCLEQAATPLAASEKSCCTNETSTKPATPADDDAACCCVDNNLDRSVEAAFSIPNATLALDADLENDAAPAAASLGAELANAPDLSQARGSPPLYLLHRHFRI